jgi:hypothetical protein
LIRRPGLFHQLVNLPTFSRAPQNDRLLLGPWLLFETEIVLTSEGGSEQVSRYRTKIKGLKSALS